MITHHPIDLADDSTTLLAAASGKVNRLSHLNLQCDQAGTVAVLSGSTPLASWVLPAAGPLVFDPVQIDHHIEAAEGEALILQTTTLRATGHASTSRWP